MSEQMNVDEVHEECENEESNIEKELVEYHSLGGMIPIGWKDVLDLNKQNENEAHNSFESIRQQNTRLTYQRLDDILEKRKNLPLNEMETITLLEELCVHFQENKELIPAIHLSRRKHIPSVVANMIRNGKFDERVMVNRSGTDVKLLKDLINPEYNRLLDSI